MQDEPVLLGVEDSPISPHLDRTSPASVSKFGGTANFPSCLPLSPPDVATVRSAFICPHCGQQRALIVQISAAIGESPFNRTLYVVACVNGECVRAVRGWACLRVQYRDTPAIYEPDQQLNAAVNSVNIDWNDGADDWSDCDDVIVTSLPEAMAEVSIDRNGQQMTDQSFALTHGSFSPIETSRPAFVPYYLSVMEEPSSSTTARPINVASADITRLVSPEYNSTENSCDQETYESAIPAHGDKLFYKLQQRLARCPRQLLRYCRDNSRQPPLILRPLVAMDDTRCRYCGARLVFELQLMPTLVSRLEPISDTSASSDHQARDYHVSAEGTGDTREVPPEVPEFGNVLVFTCADSCWSESELALRQEEVVVQLEEC